MAKRLSELADKIVQRDLPAKAIDNAFVQYVGKLFEKFCADLETEALTPAEHLSNSVLPSAQARFERSFGFARMTHSKMLATLEQLS